MAKKLNILMDQAVLCGMDMFFGIWVCDFLVQDERLKTKQNKCDKEGEDYMDDKDD